MSSPAFFAAIASFSYESRTSPLPLVNVESASAPLAGCTTVCWSSSCRNACACAGDLPSWSWAPYAAIRFHRALPELNGFGVTISTPGFTRSSQVWIPFGLPLRTTKVTTESSTNPWYWFWSQVFGTMPSSTRRSMSVRSEKWTTPAGWPDSTAREASHREHGGDAHRLPPAELRGHSHQEIIAFLD